MKSKISALMDGELEQHEAGGALEALRDEGEARDAWRRYHLIGDAMRDTQHAFGRVCGPRVAERIAQEPTVLAPSRRRTEAAQMPVWALSAAASLAAVALVGWVAFGPAGRRAACPAARRRSRRQVAADAPQVAPPAAANDYLLRPPGLLAAQSACKASRPTCARCRATCAGAAAMMRGAGRRAGAVRQPLRGASAAAGRAGRPGAAAQGLPGDREAFLYRHLRLPAGRAHRDLAHHALRRARAATSSASRCSTACRARSCARAIPCAATCPRARP